MVLAYGIVALAAVVAITVSMVLGSRSGPSEAGQAHINLRSGLTNGLRPDRRTGLEPPAPGFIPLDRAAASAGCLVRLRLPDEGHGHLPLGVRPAYDTNPPTSGDHVEEPYQQADGAYADTPEASSVVHALEHGRMAIAYSTTIPHRAQRQLIGLHDQIYGGTLLFPAETSRYAVSATTWTNLLGCEEYRGIATLEAIRAFGLMTWGRFGGEPVSAIDPGAPTPTRPADAP